MGLESVSNPQSQSNAEWMKRRSAAVARGIGHSTEIFTERAANAELWDVEGRRYVDFAGGIAVVNTGHRHPKVMAAVKAQMERFTHTCFQVTLYDTYVATPAIRSLSRRRLRCSTSSRKNGSLTARSRSARA